MKYLNSSTAFEKEHDYNKGTTYLESHNTEEQEQRLWQTEQPLLQLLPLSSGLRRSQNVFNLCYTKRITLSSET